MKKSAFLFVALTILTLIGVLGQKDYKGKVIDANTQKVIPFVNIGIVAQGIGTVSDEDGLFHLYFEKDEVAPTAVVLFFRLGVRSFKHPSGRNAINL